jgi:cellulose biosynthesis protein BcsE
VVFAFDAWDSADMVLAPLRTLAGVFEHVAVLGSRPQGSMLFVERWNGSEGALFELRLGLKQDAHSQRLAYDGSQLRGAAQRLVEAPDQYQVIATQAAVAAQRGVPAAWRVVGQLGDVLGATRDAVAATVLLDAGGTQQHEALLELVFQLRSQHGRALKIVVCETQDKLRSNLEQALLTLGANRVVYREVGFARLLRLIDDMREETFVRAIPTDYAQARSGFLPDALRGYLPLPAFCDSVQAMLARSGQRGLRHSFLRLTMLPHVAHLDAIQACMALRDGDVLSADQNALYVFLFACAETDTDPALARLFSIAPSELFAAQTLYGSSDGVNSVLRDLREAARKGVPDYSAYRSSSSVSAPRGSSKPEPQPVARLRLPLQENADHATQTPSVHARPLARRTSTSTGPIAQGANHAPTNPAGADHAD